MRPFQSSLALTALVVSILLSAVPARAQVDCSAPQTQAAMTTCAWRDYKYADQYLNEVWGPAKSFADAIGEGDALLKAQRAWLTYRDAACEVQAAPFEGGSMQPMIQALCLQRLTEERSQMLSKFHVY